MRDILIKGMEMPKSCFKCPLYTTCTEVIDSKLHDIKSDNCPLVELPPHGRLIDADALVKYIKDVYCKNCKRTKPVMCRACDIDDVLDELDDAPTILEASK